MDTIHVYVDGGCLGNGGDNPKAYASYTVEYKGEVKAKVEKINLPTCHTNNEAEYGALSLAISYLNGLFERAHKKFDVIIHTDSQLVYGQVIKGNKVKAKNLVQAVDCSKFFMTQNPTVSLVKEDREVIVKHLGH